MTAQPGASSFAPTLSVTVLNYNYGNYLPHVVPEPLRLGRARQQLG